VPVDPEMLEWADLIFVMEAAHRAKLRRRFGPHLKRARVVVLGIPDDYEFMQPALVALLEKKVAKFLPSPLGGEGGRRSRSDEGEV